MTGIRQDSLGSPDLMRNYVQATHCCSGCTGECNRSTNTVSAICYLTGPQQVGMTFSLSENWALHAKELSV